LALRGGARSWPTCWACRCTRSKAASTVVHWVPRGWPAPLPVAKPPTPNPTACAASNPTPNVWRSTTRPTPVGVGSTTSHGKCPPPRPLLFESRQPKPFPRHTQDPIHHDANPFPRTHEQRPARRLLLIPRTLRVSWRRLCSYSRRAFCLPLL